MTSYAFVAGLTFDRVSVPSTITATLTRVKNAHWKLDISATFVHPNCLLQLHKEMCSVGDSMEDAMPGEYAPKFVILLATEAESTDRVVC